MLVMGLGGGFSGSVTAAQVLQRVGPSAVPLRVAVIERRGAIGEGLAYSTRESSHLLNVPAGRMSAWPDRPGDFVGWASQRYRPVSGDEFLPRQWYGEYIRETLLSAGREASPPGQLSVILDEVRRIARHPAGGWMVHLARGDSLRAAAVVLAVGHRPPSDPLATKWAGPRTRFIADPWRPFAMSAVGADEPVVVLGSGLTAVDAVLSLAASNRRAPITLVSRRGLAPQAHSAVPTPPANLNALVSELVAADGGPCARALMHRLRLAAYDLASAGGNWRSVVDGLRPHTATLWQAMSLKERRRFLTRIRPFWEIHRHRMAPEVAERFNALVEAGAVRILAGRLEIAEAQSDVVRLVVVERANDRLVELTTRWVINCTGPVPTNSVESNPAIGSLLVHGWLHPDPLSLGIETIADGNPLDSSKERVSDLFVVGTLRKPALWESTAVPELRAQAAAAAEGVVRFVMRNRDEGAARFNTTDQQSDTSAEPPFPSTRPALAEPPLDVSRPAQWSVPQP